MLRIDSLIGNAIIAARDLSPLRNLRQLELALTVKSMVKAEAARRPGNVSMYLRQRRG